MTVAQVSAETAAAGGVDDVERQADMKTANAANPAMSARPDMDAVERFMVAGYSVRGKRVSRIPARWHSAAWGTVGISCWYASRLV